MTAFRIVDSDNEDVAKILHEMESISAIGKSILNQSQVRNSLTLVRLWFREFPFLRLGAMDPTLAPLTPKE